eukprot:2823392-Pyramimonas_sp.AAC.1
MKHVRAYQGMQLDGAWCRICRRLLRRPPLCGAGCRSRRRLLPRPPLGGAGCWVCRRMVQSPPEVPYPAPAPSL